MKFCVCQVEECHLPGLGVALTLDYRPDTADDAVSPLVSYVSGLLLGTNSKVRTWFSMFIRNGQQVRRICVINSFQVFLKLFTTFLFNSIVDVLSHVNGKVQQLTCLFLSLPCLSELSEKERKQLGAVADASAAAPGAGCHLATLPQHTWPQ